MFDIVKIMLVAAAVVIGIRIGEEVIEAGEYTAEKLKDLFTKDKEDATTASSTTSTTPAPAQNGAPQPATV
jgi:hypothetical protein